MQATKDHLNVFLYEGGTAPDPHGLITDGFATRRVARSSFTRADALDERAFVELIRAIAAQNRAGGWRALKRS